MKKQSTKQIAFTAKKKGAEQIRLSREELKPVVGGTTDVACW